MHSHRAAGGRQHKQEQSKPDLGVQIVCKMSSKRPRGEDEEGGGNDGGGDAISMSVEESNKCVL